MNILELFIAYAFIGWVWETSYVSFKQKKYVNRGFLRAPFIPIYGFGATAMVLLMEVLLPYLPASKTVALAFSIFYMGLCASFLEYGTSFLMEWAFKARWWDYSKRKFNLHGRVALGPSIFWGIGGYVIWRYINGPIQSFYQMINPILLNTFLVMVYGMILVDAYFTLRELISLRSVVLRMQALLDDFVDQVDEGLDMIEENIGDFMEQIEAHVGLRKMLERGRKYARFYRNYPDATTRKLPLVFKALRERLNR